MFLETCEEWEHVNEKGFSTPEEILKESGGLTKEDSCRWALYGWPAESELEFEKLLANWAGYTEKLRVRINYLIEQLVNRQRAINEFNKRE